VYRARLMLAVSVHDAAFPPSAELVKNRLTGLSFFLRASSHSRRRRDIRSLAFIPAEKALLARGEWKP